jgi:hypothetical protein
VPLHFHGETEIMIVRDTRTSSAGSARILPSIRVLSAVITPVLALAFGILYLLPDRNGPHFAWFVEPRMTAMMLGATYFTGVIYFSTVLRARTWNQVRLGLLPVAAFSGILGVTTILHWSEFTHANPQFWLWALLYFTLPPMIVLLWLRNERAAPPLQALGDDVLLSTATRRILAGIGVALALTTALLLLAPAFMIHFWPWELTPLTARVIAAQLALFSVFALHTAIGGRWSQIRDLLRPQLGSPLLFLGAVIFSRRDFDWASPLAWVFLAFVVVIFVLGFPSLYVAGESRRRQTGEAPAPAAAEAYPPG